MASSGCTRFVNILAKKATKTTNYEENCDMFLTTTKTHAIVLADSTRDSTKCFYMLARTNMTQVQSHISRISCGHFFFSPGFF